MICATHNKEFHEPNSQGNYWHVIDFAKKEYCNLAAPKPQVTPAMVTKAEEVKEILDKPTTTTQPQSTQNHVPWSDLRSARIERQHSQEMAIRFIEILSREGKLKEVQTPLKDLVKQYTDHFVSDLEPSEITSEGK